MKLLAAAVLGLIHIALMIIFFTKVILPLESMDYGPVAVMIAFASFMLGYLTGRNLYVFFEVDKRKRF